MEKILRSGEIKTWPDSIPLEYRYTAGVAGEEFLRELKDRGKILASKCPKCGETYVPTRMYCPDCFVETKDRLTMSKPGYVYAIATVSRDREGKQLASKTVVGLVRWEGVRGGLLHLLEGDVEIGTKVEPVLRRASERKGQLSDIVAFRKA